MNAASGNHRRAAEILGISRHALYDRLRRNDATHPANRLS
ncbi:MAG: helix-turn-helix domain-containing protein [Candidatus Binataceae bacterium]